jgi:gamma-glutamyltranspeptidase/glutathione hydrolase
MLAPVMTMDAGGRIYAPGGRLLEAGDRLDQPGLVAALELVRDESAGSAYSGSLAEALLTLSGERGGLLTRGDLDAYRARWLDPVEASYLGGRVLTREGLSAVPAALGRLPRLRGLRESERLPALLDAVEGRATDGHTTNLVTADGDGNACVLTTSLGLGSGDFLPGLDLQLNSMLGEADLVRRPLDPGERMDSMMAPTLALDGDGLALAIGAAGGTRLRTALVGVTAAVLDEGLTEQAAVDRPRAHRAGQVVNAEPGVDEDALQALEATGHEVRRWPDRHHYFGGVSLVTRSGAAGDPRRSGAARALGSPAR